MPERNPSSTLEEARIEGRVKSERDFLHGLSVGVHAVRDRVGPPMSLKLYADDQVSAVRESARSRLDGGDDGWQTFPFEAIAASAGRDYRVSIEPIDTGKAAAPDEPAHRIAVDCRPLYTPALSRIFDPWLGQRGQTLPPIPVHLERYLDRHVYECLNLRRYFFLRLAHLADAVGRIPEPVTDVLTAGSGAAYQEAFLAGRFPAMRVVATDVRQLAGDFPMPNLRFMQLDLLEPPPVREQYDLVLSIECLEHIEDYRTAFRHKAALVRPGKYLYISVPFASAPEQQDPELREMAWNLCEHYTPGFSFEDLEQLFAENDLEVLHASNMFHLDVVLPIRRIIEHISAAELECGSEAIARLLLLDLKQSRVETCRQAEGVRFLGRKRLAPDRNALSR